MTNRLCSCEIDIWDFIVIWCVGCEISDILNTRDIISKDSPSIADSTVKFYTRVPGSRVLGSGYRVIDC
jgi:hypothetical protein